MDAKRIVMLAAENGALPGGKVGGIGDVIRDLPPALAAQGCAVTVLTPGYGMSEGWPGAKLVGDIQFPFAGQVVRAHVWSVSGGDERVSCLAIEHAFLRPHGAGRIYHDDGPHAPFASDATKFAFFSAAAAKFVRDAELMPDLVHLHDWHLGTYCFLREYDPRFAALKSVRTVFTIHNLALQGIRPLRDNLSSLENWFPGLHYQHNRVSDPRYPACFNPMATAIRLSDALNTVSPTYAREILIPNNPARGYDGGEGLEGDLQNAAAAGRLSGILNGCAYPNKARRRPAWKTVAGQMTTALTGWLGRHRHVLASHLIADRRLRDLPKRRPGSLLTSVGRITDQKMRLFLAPIRGGSCALEKILKTLGKDGLFVMLGSGDHALEQRLAELASQHANFLFLAGYSEPLADCLFAAGDLFLMPSSFEPCGISQMLAMRAGQPCVVHGVGGLRDTVRDGETGFVFDGHSVQAQARNFVASTQRALALRQAGDDRWSRLVSQAAAQRFTWTAAARAYREQLYATAD